MRIAVTGRQGQVAASLAERGRLAGHDIVLLARPALDLAQPDSIARVLDGAAPDVVVSAAAYTAVDQAETDPQLAHAINATGAGALAAAVARHGIPLIHLSTDYVFDGMLPRPYVETDPTGPINVYGQSKLAGEQAVMAAHPGQTAVLRIAWVYSPFGRNFVKSMLALGRTRDEIGVVDDQFGNPTSALDIADGILTVAQNLCASDDPALRGVFHMTAVGETNWADFAAAVFAVSARRGGPAPRIRPIAGADYPTAAKRPANSRLDSRLIADVHGVTLPEWHGALAVTMDRLVAC